MLFSVAERVEYLRAVILQVDVLEVGSWRQTLQVDEVSIKANVEALHTVERHITDFKALDPHESLPLGHGEKNTGLHFSSTADSW